MPDALTRIRAMCAKLPDITEASHHGRIAFSTGGKLFMTAGHGIIGVAPDAKRRALLLASGAATPYARDKRAIEVDITGNVDWQLIEQCVFDSYAFIVQPPAPKPTPKPKPTSKPKATAKPAKKR